MSHKIIIPKAHPDHKRLTDSINTFAGKFYIKYVFLSYLKSCQKHFLIIHINDINVPEEIQKSNWIKKALRQFDTHIFIMDELNVELSLKQGTLFIDRHCNASTLIHKKEGHEFTYPELSKQFKRFRQFREDYYRTRSLLEDEIEKAKENNALTMMYHLYLSLFEHYIYHLEILCIGDYFSKGSLSERILRLEDFIPELKALMLKKTENSYFIIDALNSAKEADKEQEPSSLKDEFKDAIFQTEELLQNLVWETFAEAKKEVKKSEQKPILIENKTVSPYEPVITILTKRFRIREIFLFHQEEDYSENKKTTVLYLLLIASKINNDSLFNIMQMVSKQTEGRFNVVPIAHSGAWIQEHLWEYQEFFQKLMIPENSIFQLDIPTVIHWHKEQLYSDTCAMQYRDCNELYEKYKLLRPQKMIQSNEGLGMILTMLFYRICVIFPYATLDYLPNDINIRILWKLCAYTEPKIKDFDYLIKKLPFDFFEFINPHKNLYKNFYHLQEEHLAVLDELLQSFFDLLDKQFE
ncbi:hypothetical protein [Chryseobacterium sp. NKUCC03_KSP]|uniref:hypothetical protein n=1 Tax=Chryseobacterium sp. NKUCC03_KSP TaxID=2842125 RepID=UPI001C5BCA99|nr:hypothetical protein [Chryseobacterium sp. NKUCC03_KSP]MBW3522506.1 hypothetical protein [Chryseobacterium sp. NKUCC03_KSP]